MSAPFVAGEKALLIDAKQRRYLITLEPGGLLFTFLIGQYADRVGYAPLFAALGIFDLIGAAVLIAFVRRLSLPQMEARS